MADTSFQEKTEQASPKRREDARKKGQVARSMELNSVAILFFGLMSLTFFSGWFYQGLRQSFISNYAMIANIDLTAVKAYEIFRVNGFELLKIMFPMLAVMMVAGVLVNFAQVGLHFTPEPIIPKAEKLNFTKGFSRIFSKKTVVELFRDVIKISIIGYISYITIRDEIPNFLPLADQELSQIMSFAGMMALKVGLRVALALFLLAILDYAFQKFEFEKTIRMSKQEVKEEYKEFEGDPQIKARIRRIQREMSRRRMIQEVEKADVVITNPTHLAVALRYDMDKDSAPTVVAKGERLIAQKIKEVAKKFNIPIVEDKPLARALFETVDIGMQIPMKLYRAVAEVLAYVYKQKGKI